MPTGKSTYKSVSQSGLLITSAWCEFRSSGKQIPIGPIVGMSGEKFARQFEASKKFGFELKVKRAKVGTAKHVRVRAMFNAWSVHGTIEVLEPVITEDVLLQMFEIGGRYVGLLDWRPGSPKSPGPYGTFTASLKELGASKKSA